MTAAQRDGGPAVVTMADGVRRHEAAKRAKAFIPKAAKVWANLTDRPWNRTAMEAVLTEFALAARTEQPE